MFYESHRPKRSERVYLNGDQTSRHKGAGSAKSPSGLVVPGWDDELLRRSLLGTQAAIGNNDPRSRNGVTQASCFVQDVRMAARLPCGAEP